MRNGERGTGNGERRTGTGNLEGKSGTSAQWLPACQFRMADNRKNKRKCSGCKREFLPAVPPDDPKVFVTLEGAEKKIKSVLSQATPIGQTPVGLK